MPIYPIPELWSNVAAASGAAMIAPLVDLTEFTGRFSLDGSDQLAISAPRSVPWREEITRGRVVRCEDYLGATRELRISSRSQGTQPVLTFGARSTLRDLGNVIIRTITTGAATSYRIQDKLTIAEWFSGYIDPQASARGIDYLELGTVESTREVELDFTDRSVLWLIRELASQEKLETQWERNGETLWTLSFVEQVGASAKVVLMMPDRNLRAFDQMVEDGQQATSLKISGATPNGGLEPATIALAAFTVVASSISGDTIGVEARDGGEPLILEDDQYNGKYVLAPDATFREILDTDEATQTLLLHDASGILDDGLDDVEIREDDQGTWMTVVSSPSAEATRPDPIEGTWEEPEVRGERNYGINPFAGSWPNTTGDVLIALVDGNQGPTTTINLKGLTAYASQVIPAGSIWKNHNAPIANGKEIQSDATISGTGTVTVTLSSSATVTDGNPIWIWRLDDVPDRWSTGTSGTSFPVYQHRDRVTGGVLSAFADGNQTSADNLNIKNLDADQILYPGDVLIASVRRSIIGKTQADGSGNATVQLSASLTVSDNDAITIVQLTPPDNNAGDNYLVLPFRGEPSFSPSAGKLGVIVPTFRVHAEPDLPTLHARMGISIIAAEYSGDIGPSETIKSPSMLLTSTSPSAALGSLYLQDESGNPITLAVGDELHFEMEIEATLDVDRTMQLEIAGCQENGTTRPGAPWTVLRWMQVHLGPDADVDPVWGSHATLGLQRGIRALRNLRLEQTTFELDLLDRSLVDGYVAADEPITLGAELWAVNDDLDIEDRPRVIGFDYDFVRQKVTALLLDTRPGLTRLIR